jgi:hypothetical protein
LESTPTVRHRRYAIARRLASARFYRLLGGWNRKLSPASRYNIKRGYHHASWALDFDDTTNQDEWQKEVYAFAAAIFQENGYNSVIDLGCGSAYKLIKYFGAYKTTGIETPATCAWLQKAHPERNWLEYARTDPRNLRADLLICSDVVEHLDNPDTLMDFIAATSCRQILLSTPERDEVAGGSDFGPPENPSHYREWNVAEFRNYVSRWFDIREQRIFKDRSVTQVIVCKNQSL